MASWRCMCAHSLCCYKDKEWEFRLSFAELVFATQYAVPRNLALFWLRHTRIHISPARLTWPGPVVPRVHPVSGARRSLTMACPQRSGAPAAVPQLTPAQWGGVGDRGPCIACRRTSTFTDRQPTKSITSSSFELVRRPPPQARVRQGAAAVSSTASASLARHVKRSRIVFLIQTSTCDRQQNLSRRLGALRQTTQWGRERWLWAARGSGLGHDGCTEEPASGACGSHPGTE
jgi:hypothetical protein